MDEQTMQPKANESKTPPKTEAALFVPDPTLDPLFRQALAMTREHGWEAPSREDFEKQYRQEVAASRKP